MVAIPLTLIVERNDEQVGAFEVFQDFPAGQIGKSASLQIEHCITQGTGQAVQDGSLEQEGLDAIGLTLKDFFDQVIQYVSVAAREGLDEASDILSSLHRDRGSRRFQTSQGKHRHLQARDPSFGTGGQSSGVIRREFQARDPAQKLGSFIRREAQVGLAQFGQLPTAAQARDGQGRVGAGGDDPGASAAADGRAER